MTSLVPRPCVFVVYSTKFCTNFVLQAVNARPGNEDTFWLYSGLVPRPLAVVFAILLKVWEWDFEWSLARW